MRWVFHRLEVTGGHTHACARSGTRGHAHDFSLAGSRCSALAVKKITCSTDSVWLKLKGIFTGF